MKRVFTLAAAGWSLASLAVAAPALADVKISDQAYVRHDGGTDASIAACSIDNRQQNEPTVAVDPANPSLMTAGANDYCTVPTTGDVWAGFYYSSNGGQTWADSLAPGYSTDTSAAGRQSPAFGLVNAAGDPVQAWDNVGHVYYGYIAFNRARPANASLFVARYTWQAGPRPQYDFTTLVQRGTPSPFSRGHFEDKIGIEVDRGAASPFAGSVYVCDSRDTASGPNNGIFFYRSTDGGQTFSNAMKISDSVHGNLFCDITVTRNGTVFVSWRQFEFQKQQANAVAWVKSTDGGDSFTKPAVAAQFTGWDPIDVVASPAAAAQAAHDACLAGDSPGIDACEAARAAAAEPIAGDCGDGPLACQSGYVFHRGGSQVRITADPTAAGNPNAAYVVFDGTVPGSETPTGTSYGTVEPGTGSQSAVYLTKTTNGGGSWTTPVRVDPQAKGHQYFPDIDANAGRLNVVYQDSRSDCASGPPSTPSGGDFRTVPVSNRWVASNPPGSVSCGPGLQSFYALSVNDGASFAYTLASSVATMPQYEQFGARDVPFFGDYNYISAVGTTALMSWTDQRDTIPGTDPRYTNGDGTDGFDVLQCRVANPDGTFGPDTCPDAGGLDENTYGFVTP
jgi:hypothetical protein